MNLEKKTIAIVGVSNNTSKYGYKIFKDLINNKYNVAGINLKGGTILGKIIYKSLKELPQKPDIVITVISPSETEKIVEECHKLGIKVIWMQPGSESHKAIQKAKEYGITTINACFMASEKIW